MPNRQRFILRLASALLLMATCACSSGKLDPRLTNYDAMDGWKADRHAEALRTFRRSCTVISKKADDAVVGNGVLASPARLWKPTCSLAMNTPDTHARSFFEHEFRPFLPDAAEPHGLFTGYYEPMLNGSRTKKGKYTYPVYGVPKDLKAGVAYFTRAQIEAGSLKNRKLEILYVDDPVALFFAHIQGSARVKLDNGSITRIGYAGKNNRSYIALGKVLKDAGELEEVNMFTIREWLKNHPDRMQAMLNTNPSYVFFKEVPEGGGPKGAQGVELTAERSLAVDPKHIPYGLPLFVQTTLPQTSLSPEKAFNQLLIAQDTGGAIKGPVRGDIFFGAGAEAEAWAGMMKGRGTYILLIPNAVAAEL